MNKGDLVTSITGHGLEMPPGWFPCMIVDLAFMKSGYLDVDILLNSNDFEGSLKTLNLMRGDEVILLRDGVRLTFKIEDGDVA